MKHFLEIGQLLRDDIIRLVARAEQFKAQSAWPQFPNQTLANLFYEPSTRTRISFEMAAKNLGMRVINVDVATSSETKGEMIEDTIQTLFAMGLSYFVIRHCQEGLPKAIASAFTSGIHVINAGDGKNQHPSQALLDFLTICQAKPKWESLKIAMVGDVRHSRVANSFQGLCALMGVGELVIVGPEIWHPLAPLYGRVTTSLREGLENADVVITLRVQQERLMATEKMDLKIYHDAFAVTKKNLVYAKKDVMVMHPGPINRGIEIDSDVADGSMSYILEQVKNGVFVRMAILETLILAV